MRKIDRLASSAFLNKRRFKLNNTEVRIENNEANMYLHDNLIARTEKGKTYINHCGWRTLTTKSRLNSLGANIRMCKGTFIVNEQFEWDNNKWLEI